MSSKKDRLMYTFGVGLQNVKDLLKERGDPHLFFDVVHVAGTNGKGSVAKMIQSCCSADRKKTGTFTGPHLLEKGERIMIDDKTISPEDFERIKICVVEKALFLKKEISRFEELFLISQIYFYEKKVDLAVIEVGIGGTYDSTNVYDSPLATVITNVSLDHVELLGPTIKQIQENKMGIMKKGVPCFTWIDNKQIHEHAAAIGAELIIGEKKSKTNLLGAFQLENAGIAEEVCRYIGISYLAIQEGLQSVKHEGRVQWLSSNFVVDGSHNLSGIRAFSEYIDAIKGSKKLVLLFGSIKTLDEIVSFSSELISGNEYYLVGIESGNNILIGDIHSLLGTEYVLLDGVGSFLKKVSEGGDDVLFVAYGSLRLVGTIIREWDRIL